MSPVWKLVDSLSTGVDPLLVFAQATGYRDFRRVGDGLPDRVPVLCELNDKTTIDQLAAELTRPGAGEVPSAYHQVNAGSTLYCTAHFSRALCQQWPAGTVGRLVRRFEMQLPVIPERAKPLDKPHSRHRAGVVKGKRTKARDTLIGVIDSGCPFAHRSVRDEAGRTRLLAVWDQDDAPAYLGVGGAPPPDFGYGAEIQRTALNELMQWCKQGDAIDEDACYRRAGVAGVTARASHGAAVLDLLAGPRPLGRRTSADASRPPRWKPANDAASRADIVFVDLPRDSVQDSTSGGLGRWLLDGLRYICSHAGPKTTRIVVNISNGTSRSAHDGSSIIEAAMADLVKQQRKAGRRLHIVIAAGNDRDEERHARIDRLQPRQPQDLLLRVPPGSEAPNWVTLRVPKGATDLTLRLEAPGSTVDGPVTHVVAGEAAGWHRVASEGAAAAVVFPKPLAGSAGVALVAIAATASQGRSPQAPAGDWRLTLESANGVNEPVHAYVSRNQQNMGALARGRQARFVSRFDAYDPLRWRREAEVDPPEAASPIRRASTLNGLATLAPGSGVVVVGSRLLRPAGESPYSSVGPSAGQTGRSLRLGPDEAAVTDLYRGLPGIVVAGGRSGTVVRMRGTSLAAPQVARAIVNRR
jgi:hypothetical protein